MADDLGSDEEHYANESFEQDVTTSDGSDSEISEDEVKTEVTATIHPYYREQRDYQPFNSSTDDSEDDVIISETTADINFTVLEMENAEEESPVDETDSLRPETPSISPENESGIALTENKAESNTNILITTNSGTDVSFTSTTSDEASTQIERDTTSVIQASQESADTHSAQESSDAHSAAELLRDLSLDHNSNIGEDEYAGEFDGDDHDEVDVRISSHTPSSCYSDEYTFHMNFMKKTDSDEILRFKAAHRKSWSFSNERMRDIERQNQILLKKILTQKTTYGMNATTNAKSNNIQISTRVTSAAVNRKKQQRQIELNNKVLKRKIEAISMRRRAL